MKKEEFIERAREVHGSNYYYEKVEYVNYKTKVTITCPEHGDFLQEPRRHYRGNGCPDCGWIKRRDSNIKTRNSQRDWDFEQPEDYKLIPLTQDKYAKVDNEDFERLKDINWQLTSKGYATNKVFGRMHRYIMNPPNQLDVDHKNGDRLDNRRGNLRLATPYQNRCNSQPRIGSSRYKGVSRYNKTSKWLGRIVFNRIIIRLGLFDDEMECAKAYDKKALELWGDFAYLNFPELKEQYLKEIKK